jgi:hypothetical protein
MAVQLMTGFCYYQLTRSYAWGVCGLCLRECVCCCCCCACYDGGCAVDGGCAAKDAIISVVIWNSNKDLVNCPPPLHFVVPPLILNHVLCFYLDFWAQQCTFRGCRISSTRSISSWCLPTEMSIYGQRQITIGTATTLLLQWLALLLVWCLQQL